MGANYRILLSKCKANHSNDSSEIGSHPMPHLPSTKIPINLGERNIPGGASERYFNTVSFHAQSPRDIYRF